MQPYSLTKSAKADMQEVARYTRKQWGAAQAAMYKNKLTRCMRAFSEGNGFYTRTKTTWLALWM
jgi:toxin ParE1/3/4